jgi:hypothetical protein
MKQIQDNLMLLPDQPAATGICTHTTLIRIYAAIARA